jgi:putative membrane protein
VLFSREVAKEIDARIARAEASTGVHLVVATIGKADNYAELPWKAFVLGASLASFAVVASDFWWPQWVTADTALMCAMATLGAGAACALAAVFIPTFARLFLRRAHAHAEVHQHAQAMFLERELFRTPNRTAVLILVSRFERIVDILPDVGLHSRVSEADWQTVISAMTPKLREARPFHALQAGIAAAEDLLASKGFRSA